MRNKLLVLVAFLLTLILFFSCSEGEIEAGNLIACGKFDPATHFCDARDGRLYRFTTKMPDGNVWMAENLNYMPPYSDLSKCYRDRPENCNKYGRLYSFNEIENLCPKGWRIPHQGDWGYINDLVGVYDPQITEKELKATSGWDLYNNENGNGNGKYDFNALPGGAYNVNYYETEQYDDSCKTNRDMKFYDWGGEGDKESIGKLAAFMSTADNWFFLIENGSAPQFCVSMSALVSVRCIRK